MRIKQIGRENDTFWFCRFLNELLSKMIDRWQTSFSALCWHKTTVQQFSYKNGNVTHQIYLYARQPDESIHNRLNKNQLSNIFQKRAKAAFMRSLWKSGQIRRIRLNKLVATFIIKCSFVRFEFKFDLLAVVWVSFDMLRLIAKPIVLYQNNVFHLIVWLAWHFRSQFCCLGFVIVGFVKSNLKYQVSYFVFAFLT